MMLNEYCQYTTFSVLMNFYKFLSYNLITNNICIKLQQLNHVVALTSHLHRHYVVIGKHFVDNYSSCIFCNTVPRFNCEFLYR